MDKKERLLSALRSEPVDRPPVSFWRHFAGEEAQGKRCVEKHLEFYRAADIDFLKIMHDGFTAPFSLEVHDLQDLRAWRPRGRQNPYFTGWLERAKRVNEALQGEAYTYANVFAPFTLLRRIGDERLRYYIATDEAAVAGALDALAEELALLCQALIREGGCLGVFAAFQGAEVSRLSVEQFERLVKPADLKMLFAANEAGPWNILHFCAWDEIQNRMSSWRDYPGCAVNWAIYVDGMTLPQGRSYFGGRCVMGGFDNRRGRVLYEGTRKQVGLETLRLLEEYRQETGSLQGLLVGADCSLLTDFDSERIRWVAQAVREATARPVLL